MPWSDYLVVRLLTHSHHYITGRSLWNYSAIYHSSLHAPYTLNDRLSLHTGCLTHSVENTEFLQASYTKFSQAGMDVGHSYANLCAHTQSMHCRNMQIGTERRDRECRSHMSWPLGYNGLWICVCTLWDLQIVANTQSGISFKMFDASTCSIGLQ